MKIIYTEEQVQQARDADLVEVLRRLGYGLKKHSADEYILLDTDGEHDSCKISHDRGFYWNSRQIGGNALDFFIKAKGYDFQTAMKLIFEGKGSTDLSLSYCGIKKERKKKKFMLPNRNYDNARVISYLTNIRKIDKEIIRYYIKKGLIYESEKTHNCVFLGKDYKGEYKHAFQRGTYDKRFAGDVEGSDKRYAFRIESNNGNVHVFEATIDMLSYITMEKRKGNRCRDTYLSLNSGSMLALDAYMEESGIESQNLYIRTDNCSSGWKFAEKIIIKYMNKLNVFICMPKNKDYNDDLIEETQGETDND